MTGQRKFEVGVWLDIKDTIDQWLEAQVTQIRPNQIYVHYNGWGSRWDEWIDNDSVRIAVFRTYTVQNPKCIYLSPFPNILPEQRLAQQAFDQDTFTNIVRDLSSMLQETSGVIQNFELLREKKNKVMAEKDKHSNQLEQKGSSLIDSSDSVH